jgi:hypothetical protein
MEETGEFVFLSRLSCAVAIIVGRRRCRFLSPSKLTSFHRRSIDFTLAQAFDLEKQVALKKQKKEQIKIEPDAVTSSGDTAAGDSSGLDRVESSVSTTPQMPEDEQSAMNL